MRRDRYGSRVAGRRLAWRRAVKYQRVTTTVMAVAVPSAQPATTSESQWTPTRVARRESEERSGCDEHGLRPSATGDGDREAERRGKEERGGVGGVTGRERGSRDVGGVGRDRWAGSIESGFGDAGGEAAERERDDGSRRQSPMPVAPPQPESDHYADDEQRDETSDRAQEPGRADQPVGAVIDEPGQHCLVTRDETAAIDDVFGDQDEQRQAGRHEGGCDQQRAAGRGRLGAKWHRSACGR